MKSIPEISVDTRLLLERLKALQPGEHVSYDDLSAAIGRDVRQAAYHNLASAIRMALNQHGIVVAAVLGVGLKRLTDEENVNTIGEATRRHIGRVSRRAVRKMTAVNFDALPNDLKLKQNAEVSQLSALRAFSNNRATDKIQSRIAEGKNEPLALAKTLEAFKG